MGIFRFAINKVKAGLQRTRQTFSGLANLLLGKNLSDELINELESKLIHADVGVKTSLTIIEHIRQAYRDGEMKSGDEAFAYLKQYMIDFWPEQDREIKFAESGPTVILVAGINGAGKTTSIAKMAQAFKSEGHKVMLAACDTFRAGAVHQLGIWAERLGVEIIRGQEGGDPAAVAWDAAQAAVARKVDVLLVDTAGRLPTQKPLMDQLTKIRNTVAKQIPGSPHEVILVLDATIGQNAIQQAIVFNQAIDVTGLMLAKLDGTAKGGIVVAIREQLNIPVKFIGVGETPDDIQPFEPDQFVEAMFSVD